MNFALSGLPHLRPLRRKRISGDSPSPAESMSGQRSKSRAFIELTKKKYIVVQASCLQPILCNKMSPPSSEFAVLHRMYPAFRRLGLRADVPK